MRVAREELQRGAGSQFDPQVVEAFCACSMRVSSHQHLRSWKSGRAMNLQHTHEETLWVARPCETSVCHQVCTRPGSAMLTEHVALGPGLVSRKRTGSA